MKFKAYTIAFLTLLNLITISARAGAPMRPELMSTGGGNGGDPREIRMQTVLNEIRGFFLELDNQKEFPEVDFNTFDTIISGMRPYATNQKLLDKFGHERCMLNENAVIFINRACWDKTLANKEQDHFAMAFHEVLGEMGVETAGKFIPSEYKVSARLNNFVERKEVYGLIGAKKSSNINKIAVWCKHKSGSNWKRKEVRFFVEFNEDHIKVKTRRYKSKVLRNIVADITTKRFQYYPHLKKGKISEKTLKLTSSNKILADNSGYNGKYISYFDFRTAMFHINNFNTDGYYFEFDLGKLLYGHHFKGLDPILMIEQKWGRNLERLYTCTVMSASSDWSDNFLNHLVAGKQIAPEDIASIDRIIKGYKRKSK